MMSVVKTKTIQILATSDLHNHFYSYDYTQNKEMPKGGLLKIASLIKQLRKNNPHTLLIDNGDTIQDNASSLFLQDEILPMILGMNTLCYDVWVAGNHEFNYGIPLLEKAVESFHGHFLLANVKKINRENGEKQYLKGAKPFVLVNLSGIQVAIIGVVTPHIVKWDAANLKGYEVLHPENAVASVLEEIKRNHSVDLVIVSFHASVDGEYGNDSARELASSIKEIDLIIAGHEHVVMKEICNNTIILEPGKFGEQLAQVNFTFKENERGRFVLDKSLSEFQNVELDAIERDEELIELLHSYHHRALMDAEKVIGYLEGDSLVPEDEIKGIPQAQLQDTAMFDLILNVQMKVAAQNFVLPAYAHHVSSASLFMPTNVYPGEIRKSDIAKLYKFDNTLFTIKTKGARLKRYMEWSARYYNQYQEGDLTISFNPNIRMYQYDIFAGVDYQIDLSEKVGRRVIHLVYSDSKKPVQDDDIIYLSTNNYRVNSTLLQSGEGILGEDVEVMFDSNNNNLATIRDMIIAEIESLPDAKLHAKVDHNWSLTGFCWDENKRQQAIKLINNNVITVPRSKDGRTLNVQAVTEKQLETLLREKD